MLPGLAPAAVASDPDRQSRNVVWRVRMAEQTLAITAAHPQGTGVGSFPAVIHRYQRYPMLWSNSAHNFYLETLATGGPLRLLLLLAILGTAVVAGWRTERWPVALGGSRLLGHVSVRCWQSVAGFHGGRILGAGLPVG